MWILIANRQAGYDFYSKRTLLANNSSIAKKYIATHSSYWVICLTKNADKISNNCAEVWPGTEISTIKRGLDTAKSNPTINSHRWSCTSKTFFPLASIKATLDPFVFLLFCIMCVCLYLRVCIAMLCLVPSGRRCWDKTVVFMLSNTPLLYAQIGRSDNSLCK